MHRKKETEEEGSDGNLAKKKKTISTLKVMSTHMWVVFFSLKKTLYFWPPVKKKMPDTDGHSIFNYARLHATTHAACQAVSNIDTIDSISAW